MKTELKKHNFIERKLQIQNKLMKIEQKMATLSVSPENIRQEIEALEKVLKT